MWARSVFHKWQEKPSSKEMQVLRVRSEAGWANGIWVGSWQHLLRSVAKDHGYILVCFLLFHCHRTQSYVGGQLLRLLSLPLPSRCVLGTRIRSHQCSLHALSHLILTQCLCQGHCQLHFPAEETSTERFVKITSLVHNKARVSELSDSKARALNLCSQITRSRYVIHLVPHLTTTKAIKAYSGNLFEGQFVWRTSHNMPGLIQLFYFLNLWADFSKWKNYMKQNVWKAPHCNWVIKKKSH